MHHDNSPSRPRLNGTIARHTWLAAGVALTVSACNARLAVLEDDVGGAENAGAGSVAGDTMGANDPNSDAGLGGAPSEQTGSGGGAQASCDDGVHNGEESAMDCGGPACAACTPALAPCTQSPALIAFSAGAAGPSNGFSFAPPLVSDDGSVVAFDLCYDRTCRPAIWTASAGTRLLEPAAARGSKTVGMTADGERVLVSPPPALGAEAWVYTPEGGAVGTGLSPSHVLLAAGGSVVGIDTAALGSSNLMRWTEAGGLETLATLPFDAEGVALDAVTPSASLIVGSGGPESERQSFRWSAANGLELGMTGLPVSASRGEIRAVSADGAAIAGLIFEGADVSGVFHSLDGADPVNIGSTRTDYSTVVRLSDDGSVLAGTLSTDQQLPSAVRWTLGAGATPLTPGLASAAEAMSGDGSIIVGALQDYSADPPHQTPYFVWSAEHGARDLFGALSASGVDLSGWTIYSGNALSRDGRVLVGHGACGESNTIYRMELPD